ncbi:MAG: NADH-quinone oxidoreductase subunit H [Oscillospiraceae bacterium]|nr:NADH-quinone oxidoreductase subunit H [Oscillospiraceae bacterium]
MTILENAFSVLVFPGLLFVAIVGLLLAGIDRKILARMQKRKGPPILQPFYDFFKLMGKETIVPDAANKRVFLAAPIVGFSSLVVMMLFIPIFGYTAFSTQGDMIILLYLLTIPAVAMIIGGSASGSPYAGIGISREMVTMMAYELPLVIVLLSVAKAVGGDELCFSMRAIGEFQQESGLLIANWRLIPAAIAFLLVIPAEVGTQPFDVAEAETEICEGPLVEYSGAPLAMFKLNTAIKMFIMTALFTVLFFGGINTGYVALNALILVAISAVLTVITMTLAHAICARLKIEHLFKFYWTFVAGLAAISLILVWIF